MKQLSNNRKLQLTLWFFAGCDWLCDHGYLSASPYRVTEAGQTVNTILEVIPTDEEIAQVTFTLVQNQDDDTKECIAYLLCHYRDGKFQEQS